MSEKTFPTERPSFRTQAHDNGPELVVVLPGVSREQLSVNIEDHLLSITGERRFEGGAEERDYQLRVRLHEDLDPLKIEASHQDGILRLKLNRRPELKPRQIDILAN